MKLKTFSWIAQVVAAVIMLQSLFFKFTGQPVSVELFSILGVEPWGRILTGVLELAASIMLVVPALIVYGAVLTLIIMFGAIMSHLLFIGIDFGGDISLFFLAILTFVLAGFVLWARTRRK